MTASHEFVLTLRLRVVVRPGVSDGERRPEERLLLKGSPSSVYSRPDSRSPMSRRASVPGGDRTILLIAAKRSHQGDALRSPLPSAIMSSGLPAASPRAGAHHAGGCTASSVFIPRRIVRARSILADRLATPSRSSGLSAEVDGAQSAIYGMHVGNHLSVVRYSSDPATPRRFREKAPRLARFCSETSLAIFARR